MNSTLSISLFRQWVARSLAGLVLLAAILALAWPADARQRGEDAKTLPEDLKLVPGDTGMFASVRVSDLLGSALGKKLLPGMRELTSGPQAELEKLLGIPLTDVERLTVLAPHAGSDLVLIVRTSRAYNRERLIGAKAEKLDIAGKTF